MTEPDTNTQPVEDPAATPPTTPETETQEIPPTETTAEPAAAE